MAANGSSELLRKLFEKTANPGLGIESGLMPLAYIDRSFGRAAFLTYYKPTFIWPKIAKKTLEVSING